MVRSHTKRSECSFCLSNAGLQKAQFGLSARRSARSSRHAVLVILAPPFSTSSLFSHLHRRVFRSAPPSGKSPTGIKTLDYTVWPHRILQETEATRLGTSCSGSVCVLQHDLGVGTLTTWIFIANISARIFEWPICIQNN